MANSDNTITIPRDNAHVLTVSIDGLDLDGYTVKLIAVTAYGESASLSITGEVESNNEDVVFTFTKTATDITERDYIYDVVAYDDDYEYTPIQAEILQITKSVKNS